MASLPPYETLVRWTVADTTKWLSENGLGDYKDSFRKEGVDGSKLAKLTDTDIDNLKSAPTKKRIQLKNAVANIDRSRVNSLPRTQGMMNRFRQTEIPSEPAPPPRPPRHRQPLPHEMPTHHAPPEPPAHDEFEDDNEDAYSWGDDFNYQSDEDGGDEDYENDKDWTQQDHNSNNIGYDRQPTYEEANDEDFYEEPANSPSQSFTGGGIVEKLQKELTRRSTVKQSTPSHIPVANDAVEDEDEDYETPLADPPVPPLPPARPPRPGQRSQPPIDEPPPGRAPPRPVPHSRAPPPIPVDDDDEQVYDEPDEDRKIAERAKKKVEEKKRLTSRTLPPVPPPGLDDRAPLPTPPRNTGKRPPIPKLPPEEPEETYEPMDAPQPQRTMPSRVPDIPKSSKSKPQPTQRSSRPLPHVPTPTDSPVRKGRNAVPAPVKRDELELYDWYHKNIERTIAESSLMDLQKDGMYLIRKSKRGGTEQQYTLTIYKQQRVYNLPIRKRQRDGKFALGAEKPNELDFESVPNLVEYFKTKLIMLNPKARNASGSTRLIIPMPK